MNAHSIIKLCILGAAVLLVDAAFGWGAPGIKQDHGVYVIENKVLRAEMKRTELYRLVSKPDGRELMSHGTIGILAKGELPGQGKDQWLRQDSLASHIQYATQESGSEATLTVAFDWGPGAGKESPWYQVSQQITLFADKPYVRLRYHITSRSQHPRVEFMMASSGTPGTHLIEPGGETRVEKLDETRLGSFRDDPANYWFAYWNQPTGHFVAFLRPGQTNPTQCMFTRGRWYVARGDEPFLPTPGQSHDEELWIVAGRTADQDPARVARAATEAYGFVAKNNPILAVLQSPYVTHKQLVEQTKHLRADGRGEHIVYKNERLYVEGKPFLLFAPWGVYSERLALYKKYHLTGVMGALRHADEAAQHDLMLVGGALEWPRKRGKELEEHIRSYSKHPAVLAWFLADDFAGDLSMLANIEAIRRADTHRPTVADVHGYDSHRRQASAFLDINAPYTYPAPIHTYRWYADYLEHNLKIMQRQFNWTCPQAWSYSRFASTGQSIKDFGEYPTPAQMRLQTYVGLAHGIRGFMYWPHEGLVDYKLSELGILCLEVEPLTRLIVEGEKIRDRALTDAKQIEVERLDWRDHSLLFLINHRDRSERWPTGEFAPKFTVTLRGTAANMHAYSMTFDEELRLTERRQSGGEVELEVSGLDVAAMVLLTSDARYASNLRHALEERRRQAAEFAATTNKYMAGKVHRLLGQLGRMQAPMGRAAQFYNEAVARIENETSLTGQRRIDRLLRQAIGEALAEADRLQNIAPAFARNSILINVWQLPQFMASFNFRARKSESPLLLVAPPAIAPMVPLAKPPAPQPLTAGRILVDTKSGGGYHAHVAMGATCCVFRQCRGEIWSWLSVYPNRLAYDASQSEQVPLPHDNLSLSLYLCRPSQDIDLHVLAPAKNDVLGILTSQPVQVGQKIAGPRLSTRNPIALYEIRGTPGDSFEVGIATDKGCVFDMYLCQAYPSHAQTLAYARTEGGKQTGLRATLLDAGPLVVLVERFSGDGAFQLTTRKLTESVGGRP